ncbi:MAG: ATP-binding cassette domain-containing protein [Candidatus Nitronauta litoralis]|uniref:ATP-binding cassette domain-containing protein n=1 Tax=Candidatus Nitronauta litoralis TaxID=2705533 RepID=A0A7T0G075_9BACT|nr:MAG: ATP-binding cassette domain-containing protein [Candidatus Nitronauta litoralis]
MISGSSQISVNSLCVRFGNNLVLEDIKLNLPANSITTFLGPSGAGKSTLLRTLCRMNDRLSGFSQTGSVEIFGENIYGENTDLCELRRRVGLLFQKPCVFPKNIYQNVIFGLNYHRPKDRILFPDLVEQALVQAGLWQEVKDRLEAPAQALSQGQQQRLSLARTLALDPDVLLLDEPTASLDQKSAAVIEEMALSLKSSRTLVWVTHDPLQAQRISDTQIILDQGKVLPEDHRIRKIS